MVVVQGQRTDPDPLREMIHMGFYCNFSAAAKALLIAFTLGVVAGVAVIQSVRHAEPVQVESAAVSSVDPHEVAL